MTCELEEMWVKPGLRILIQTRQGKSDNNCGNYRLWHQMNNDNGITK